MNKWRTFKLDELKGIKIYNMKGSKYKCPKVNFYVQSNELQLYATFHPQVLYVFHKRCGFFH